MHVNGIQFFLNGTSWTSDTLTDWGYLNPGQNVRVTFNVSNGYNYGINISLITPDLPLGWTETWYLNNTIIPATTVQDSAILTLTVDPSATPRPYYWTMYALTTP